MKKVLILAYDFPPYVSVGGLRPYSWYKYMKDFGLHPVIVTRQWGNKYGNQLDYIAPGESDKTIVEETEFGTIIRTPYKPNLSNRLLLKYGESKFKILRKAITAYYELMQFVFFIGTKSELYFGAKEYLKNNKVECIVATGEPFVLFKYASKLNNKHGVPWLADYRDPWTQNKNRSSNLILHYFNSYNEKKYLKNASGITTVSEFLQHQISSIGINQPFHILPNGFNHELMNDFNAIKRKNECLNIAFMGTIYDWHPWKSFISSYCQFVFGHPDVSVKMNLYGVNVAMQIKSYILENHPTAIAYFSFTSRLSNQEVIKELTHNHVMLLFNDYSILGTKIFDYLGIKRKIILCYSDDREAIVLKDKYYTLNEIQGISKTLQADLIQETKSGIIVKDANHLESVLKGLWEEFQKTGMIECNSVGVEKFSRREQVMKLAKIIHEM
jgi:glycosyltransferase involved in cell wall biosynthesis